MKVPASTAATVHLRSGEFLTVVSGEVSTFVQAPGGRRLPFATAIAGMAILGPQHSDESALIAVPLPGAIVELCDARSDREPETESVRNWLAVMTRAASHNRWPIRIVNIDERNSTFAPGEAVINDTEDVMWVRVTSGSAKLFGATLATLSPLDGSFPLYPGGWLEAGLRCRISLSDPQPSANLTLTSLAMRVVADRWNQRMSTKLLDIEQRAAREQSTIVQSVTELAAAISPMVASTITDPRIIPAIALAQAHGVDLTEDQSRDANQLLAKGKDPLEAVAAVANLSVRQVQLDPDWQTHEGLPFLTQFRDLQSRENITVLLSWRRGSWQAVDPSSQQPIALPEIVAQSPSTAWEFQPRLPSIPQRIFDLTRLAFRGSTLDAVYVVAAAIVAAVLAYWSPKVLGNIATLITEQAEFPAFAALFMLLAAFTVAGAMWMIVQSLALIRIRARATSYSATAIWSRLLRQPARWHADRTLGNRTSQGLAVNTAAGGLSDQSVVAILNLFTLFGSVAAIWQAGVNALLIISVLLLVQATIGILLLRRSSHFLAGSIEASATASGRLVETLTAIARLRVAGAESRAFLRWTQAQSEYVRLNQLMRTTTMIDGVVRTVWPTLILSGLVISYATGSSTFGDFITAQSAATTATTTLSTAVATLGVLVMTRRTLDQVRPVLASIPEAAGEGEDPGTISGGFRLNEISFGYSDGPLIIEDFSLEIEPGEHIAFVGPSGCGKSTIMRLILGLENPHSGVITCDGFNMESLDRTSLRKQIGSVLQSSKLLPGTLRDNVTLGRPLTTQEIWAALDAASLGADVRAMPMQLETPVTDGGGTLSGGQMQRVLIARALAGNPRALVLDEATSALDNATQQAVVESLEALRITRIVVAHRLSTIRHADRIIVLESGKIMDTGTYAELMTRPGLFHELVRRQQAA